MPFRGSRQFSPHLAAEPGGRGQVVAAMAGLLKKKVRTRGDPNLAASDLQKVFEGVLQTQGSWDLNHYLRHFERCTWKTSATLSVAGLAATEDLWRELLLLEPSGVTPLNIFACPAGEQ